MSKGSGAMALPRSGIDGADDGFAWDRAAELLAGLPGGGLNIGHESVDRHVAAGFGSLPALRWLNRQGERRDISYGELADLAARAAQVLRQRGIGRGDVVAVLLPRRPELVIAALAIWKIGAVFCPLSTSFGPGPIKSRLELGGAKLLIAAEPLYAAKVASRRAALPGLQTVMLVESGKAVHADCASFDAALAATEAAATETEPTRADSPAFLHFTSGTTGTPKVAVHSHRAVLSLLVTGRQVFGLKDGDVYWCTADPGWITATAYGIVAPLANRCCALLDEADFDPRHWYTVLRDQKVTAWYTTPTAIRMMMRHGAALARSFRENSLRVAASVGEPLNAEAVGWGIRAFGLPFLDTWWQTEIGAIAIANSEDHSRPGSMGRPLPGISVRVVTRRDSGLEEASGAETIGELAVKADMPSLFTGYLGDPARFNASFIDGWFLTGDLVRRDDDGFLWFVGRSDDMIKSAGQSIGPFELESTLLDHPAVAEAGVVGKAEALLREVPVAFVSLNPGFEAGEALRRELLSFARQTLGAAMAPQEIHFVDALPKTTSGKIVRRTLKLTAAGKTEIASDDGMIDED